MDKITPPSSASSAPLRPALRGLCADEILSLNQQGFIPGPGETAPDFLARVQRAKTRYEEGDWLPPSHWEWTREWLGQLFDVKPLYICAFYSSRSLRPWQGAAAWIEGRELHSIQLRKGFYKKEEFLSHEAVHAARSGFHEHRFEEYFAYMTSEKKWRRVLGPVVQRPWEVWPLMVCFGTALWSPIGFLGAAFWTGLGFIRLLKGHRQLARASEALLKVVQDSAKARAILFRLTDREILLLAQGEDFISYANRQTELRWRVIQQAYLKEIYGKENSSGK